MAVDLTFRELYALRDRLTAIDAEHTCALSTLHQLLVAPPTVGEIVEACRRSIDAAAADFEAQFAVQLSDPQLADVSAISGAGAVAYLMRGTVLSKVPDLVQRLCPGAVKGEEAAERAERIKVSRAKLAALWDERKAIQQQLGKQRVLLSGFRQDAMHAKDWRTRCAIESQLSDLTADVSALGLKLQQPRVPA